MYIVAIAKITDSQKTNAFDALFYQLDPLVLQCNFVAEIEHVKCEHYRWYKIASK